MLIDGKMSQKRFDFCLAHIDKMLFVMKIDKTLDPLNI